MPTPKRRGVSASLEFAIRQCPNLNDCTKAAARALAREDRFAGYDVAQWVEQLKRLDAKLAPIVEDFLRKHGKNRLRIVE